MLKTAELVTIFVETVIMNRKFEGNRNVLPQCKSLTEIILIPNVLTVVYSSELSMFRHFLVVKHKCKHSLHL